MNRTFPLLLVARRSGGSRLGPPVRVQTVTVTGRCSTRSWGLVPTDVLTTRLDWLAGDRTASRPPPFVPPAAAREEDELPHVHAAAMLATQSGRRAGSLGPELTPLTR
jgi:hypothetical protein